MCFKLKLPALDRRRKRRSDAERAAISRGRTGVKIGKRKAASRRRAIKAAYKRPEVMARVTAGARARVANSGAFWLAKVLAPVKNLKEASPSGLFH